MSVLFAVSLAANLCAVLASAALLLEPRLRPRWMRGRVVSRRVVSAFGYLAARNLRIGAPWFAVCLTAFVSLSAVFAVPRTICWVALAAWYLDDLLTGGDRKPRRRRDWAKANLRAIKPVRLRPAERWVPSRA